MTDYRQQEELQQERMERTLECLLYLHKFACDFHSYAEQRKADIHCDFLASELGLLSEWQKYKDGK